MVFCGGAGRERGEKKTIDEILGDFCKKSAAAAKGYREDGSPFT
jgi:hypothetical protein